MMTKITQKLIVIFIGTFFLSLTNHGQDVSLMSFNIGSSNWIGNRDSVVARIVVNDPDIFCAIEATGNTRPFIESAMTEYNLLQTFGANPNLSESHIFYRRNMFTVIDSGFMEMETYGGYNGPGRFVNWARLEEKSSQNQFLVYASHFVFVFPADPDSSTIGQYRHANGMVQLMNQHSSLNIPMITVGDFNADSSKAVMQFLVDQTSITFNSTTITNPIVLDDSWYVANPSIQKPGTVGAGSTAIDWILTTPNTNVTSAIIDDQGVNPNGNFPSDHRPLVIVMNLTSTSSLNESYNSLEPKVFPNPFQTNFTIDLNEEISGPVSVIIYNVTGEVVKQFEKTELSNQQIVVNLPGIENGVYFYYLETSRGLFSGMILKE